MQVTGQQVLHAVFRLLPQNQWMKGGFEQRAATAGTISNVTMSGSFLSIRHAALANEKEIISMKSLQLGPANKYSYYSQSIADGDGEQSLSFNFTISPRSSLRRVVLASRSSAPLNVNAPYDIMPGLFSAQSSFPILVRQITIQYGGQERVIQAPVSASHNDELAVISPQFDGQGDPFAFSRSLDAMQRPLIIPLSWLPSAWAVDRATIQSDTESAINLVITIAFRAVFTSPAITTSIVNVPVYNPIGVGVMDAFLETTGNIVLENGAPKFVE